MENSLNDFKFSKSLLGKLLAIFGFVLAVFSLILFCVAYLNNSSFNMSNTLKGLQLTSCILAIITTGIFVVYYLLFRHKKNFDFIVSTGLIILCITHLFTIISTFTSLAEEINRTSKRVDVSPKIVEALSSIVIPVLTIVVFALSAYFILKRKPIYLAIFVTIPAIITLISYISIPLLTSLADSTLSDGMGKFIEFYALCETSIYCCLFVLGLDLNSEYKKKAEAKFGEVEAPIMPQTYKEQYDNEPTEEIIVTSNENASSNETLKKLQSAKKAFDDGIITQEEYDFIKATLNKKL